MFKSENLLSHSSRFSFQFFGNSTIPLYPQPSTHKPPVRLQGGHYTHVTPYRNHLGKDDMPRQLLTHLP